MTRKSRYSRNEFKSIRIPKDLDDHSSRRVAEFSSSECVLRHSSASRDRPRRLESIRSIREARSPDVALSFSACTRASRLSRAYITRSPVQQHASRVTVQWRSSGRKAEEEEEEGARAMTKQREGERKGGPFVVAGRCFRLRRPCRLINNTISPFLRAFLSFSPASAASSSGPPSPLHLSARDTRPPRKPN